MWWSICSEQRVWILKSCRGFLLTSAPSLLGLFKDPRVNTKAEREDKLSAQEDVFSRPGNDFNLGIAIWEGPHGRRFGAAVWPQDISLGLVCTYFCVLAGPHGPWFLPQTKGLHAEGPPFLAAPRGAEVTLRSIMMAAPTWESLPYARLCASASCGHVDTPINPAICK